MDTEKTNIILIPTDFSTVCENALNYGAQLAKAMDSKLALLHVINKESRSELRRSGKGIETIAEKLKSICEQINRKHNIYADFYTREGSIFAEIHKTAKDISASLLILGTHGKKGMQRLIGSHALRVLTRVPVPTIIIQNKPFIAFKKIVFPVTDFTDARQKTKWVNHLAKTFDSEIHLFIQNQPDPGLNVKVQHLQQQVIELFKEGNITYREIVAEKPGHLSKQIIKYAGDIRASLIMIMTGPDVYSSDYKLGHWDEEIMFNKSEIPVMCINPDELSE